MWSPGLQEPLHLYSQTHKCAQVTAAAVRTCPARGIMGRRWAVFALLSPDLDPYPHHHHHTLSDYTRFQRKASISALSSPGLDTRPPPSVRDLHLITQFMPGPRRAEAPAQASPCASKGRWDFIRRPSAEQQGPQRRLGYTACQQIQGVVMRCCKQSKPRGGSI